MLKNKFVLVDNEIIIGRVAFHKQLHQSPMGGGMWYYHTEQNKLILYGTSHDFGPISKKEALNAKVYGIPKGFELIFDERNNHEALDILKDHLGELEGVKCYNECDYI